MIHGLLDNDFYKLTMMYAVWKAYPKATVKYRFIDRNEKNDQPSSKYTESFVAHIKEQIQSLHGLRFNESELNYLKTLKIFDPSFLSYLKNDFTWNSDYIHCQWSGPQKGLQLSIEGPWLETMLFEVPLLAVISESYFKLIDTNWNHDLEAYKEKSLKKAEALSKEGCIFSDFGTRRRRSFEVQQAALEGFSSFTPSKSTYIGTSNILFSQKYGTPPIGTMAHEWIMGHGGMFGIPLAHQRSLEVWHQIYGKNFQIALSDTYTTDLFFKDFTSNLAQTYTGVRQESSSALKFIDKAVAFYTSQNIDPKTKKVVFSDGLDVQKAISIQHYAKDKLLPVYGIGTSLTNDFENSPPLNIVIKLFEINGTRVAKVTDDELKATGTDAVVKETSQIIKTLLLAKKL